MIWASQETGDKANVLKLYKRAWQKIHGSEPNLNNNAPVNFLNDSAYTCSKPVPWRPQVEARFSDPLSSQVILDTSTPEAEAGPSNPSIVSSSTSQIPPKSDIAEDEELSKLLKTAEFDAIYTSPYPRIKHGLFPGLSDYIKFHSPKTKLRVVFPIFPKYIIDDKDNESAADVCIMELDKEDVSAITKEDKRCMHLTPEQSDCAEGRAKYFCASWVRHLLSFQNGLV